MLTRQRQLLQQQQATKRTASTQLPPAGGSSAGRPKAVAQRTAAAVRQKVQQDVTVTRALADNMRRNQERANRQIPADKSPKVRLVGPGGANPRPQGQLPPGQRGGEIRSRGGALTTRSSGGPLANPSNTIQPVRVRDLGNTQRPQLTGQRDLPGGTGGGDTVRGSGARTGRPGPDRAQLPQGTKGGDLARVDSPRRSDAQARLNRAAAGSSGPNRVGQPAGSANRMYGAGRVNAAVDRAVKATSSRRSIGRGSVAALALSGISAIQDAMMTPAQRKVKNDNSISWDNRNKDFVDKSKPTPKSQAKAKPASVADYKDAQGNTYDGNSGRLKQAKKPANPTPAPARTGSSGSGGNSGGSAPTAPRSSSAPARRSAAPASNAGMKNQDKNFRGNLFEKTFGYKRGEAPDQVKNKPPSFDTKSDVYTPNTKVDGSKLNALKIDQKKVDEYNRRKGRYYS